MLRRFFALNREVCRRIAPYLPQATDLSLLYERIVAQHMNAKPGQVIADVGGGKACPFAKYRDPAAGSKLIAVDVSDEELQYNRDADETRVADITQELPFNAGEVDIIASRYVLEHVKSLDSFMSTSKQVLKPGGYFIHLFPSKYAPFALINQALPNYLSKTALSFFRPGSEGIGGFPAYYNRCHYSGIRILLKKYGFEMADLHLGYYQNYFDFFVPLFLVTAFYGMIVQAFGAKDLAAFVLIVARKNMDI